MVRGNQGYRCSSLMATKFLHGGIAMAEVVSIRARINSIKKNAYFIKRICLHITDNKMPILILRTGRLTALYGK